MSFVAVIPLHKCSSLEDESAHRMNQFEKIVINMPRIRVFQEKKRSSCYRDMPFLIFQEFDSHNFSFQYSSKVVFTRRLLFSKTFLFWQFSNSKLPWCASSSIKVVKAAISNWIFILSVISSAIWRAARTTTG